MKNVPLRPCSDMGMEEVSVGDPAACRGESRVPSTYTEGRGGFGPFVDEGNDRVATLESLRASLRGLRHMEFDGVASSGCERDSRADAGGQPPFRFWRVTGTPHTPTHHEITRDRVG